MVGLVADVCLIVRKTYQRRPDSFLGTIREWVLNCIPFYKSRVLFFFKIDISFDSFS